MNNRFRKVSSAILAMLMLASLSSCSIPGGLSDSTDATKKKSGYSHSNMKDDDATDDDNIESMETKYNRGIEFMKAENFSEAQSEFEACGDYEFALDLINVCKAEIELQKGNYNRAQTYYSKVSEKAEVTGFDIQQKKANLSSRIAVKKMEGNYRTASNNITMTKYKKKKKVQWYYNIGIWSDQYLELTCTENADGTFNVTGNVQFQRYTKFAKKESKIKKGPYKLPINLKNITKFPAKITLAKGVTLTYDSGVFVVNYSKTTKKGKTKIVYKSRVAYKKSK